MDVLSFFRFIIGGFPHLSFPQEKDDSETPIELFLLSEKISYPATLIFHGPLAEIVVLTFLLCLEASIELKDL